MAKKFVFDTEKWGALIGRCRESIATDYGQDVPGLYELAELLEVSRSSIDAWEMCKYQEGFEHPNTTNILKVCNLAGFNPNQLWKVEG